MANSFKTALLAFLTKSVPAVGIAILTGVIEALVVKALEGKRKDDDC